MKANVFKIKELKSKLEYLDKDAALQMIYMWVKQNHIDLEIFRILIEGVTDESLQN